MTDNKNMTDTELNMLATKIVSRMLKVKTMEDWFSIIYWFVTNRIC